MGQYGSGHVGVATAGMACRMTMTPKAIATIHAAVPRIIATAVSGPLRGTGPSIGSMLPTWRAITAGSCV
jgi:hypothetical protein